MACTIAWLTIVIPNFERLCFRRLAISASKRGSISRQYSSTVTCTPKAAITEASSSPMTPAPIIQRRPGRESMPRSSREVMTSGSSAPGTGGTYALEPVAIIMSDAVYPVSPTTTVSEDLKAALPCTRVMSLCPSSVSTPPRSCSTTAFFRSITARKSTSHPPDFTPNVPDSLISRTISALRHSDLVGMHPSFRQVPPTWPASIIVTDFPLEAARRAVS